MPPPYEILSDDDECFTCGETSDEDWSDKSDDECPTCGESSDEDWSDKSDDECPTCGESSDDESCSETYCKYCHEKK